VGGYGRMGRWFASYLRRKGHRVWITGRKGYKLARASRQLRVPKVGFGEAAPWVDTAIISVPPQRIGQVVKQYDSLLDDDCLVVDISSIKRPVEKCFKALRRPVLVMHPFWGGSADSIKGRNLAVTYPRRLEPRARTLVEDLEKGGAVVTRCTPEEHDKAITFTLALPHLLGAVYGFSLSLSELPPRRLGRLGGRSFQTMLGLARAVAEESPEVYAAIQMAGPRYAKILREVSRRIDEIASGISGGRADRFMETLITSSRALGMLGGS